MSLKVSLKRYISFTRKCSEFFFLSFLLSACSFPKFYLVYPDEPEKVPELTPSPVSVTPPQFSPLSQEIFELLNTPSDPHIPTLLKERTLPQDFTVLAQAYTPHSFPEAVPNLITYEPNIPLILKERILPQDFTILAQAHTPNSSLEPLPHLTAYEPQTPFTPREKTALQSPIILPKNSTHIQKTPPDPLLNLAISAKSQTPFKLKEKTAPQSPIILPKNSTHIQKTPPDPLLNLAISAKSQTPFKLKEKTPPPEPAILLQFLIEIQKASYLPDSLPNPEATEAQDFELQQVEILSEPAHLPETTEVQEISYLPDSLPVSTNAKSLKFQQVKGLKKPLKLSKPSVEILTPDILPELVSYEPKDPSPLLPSGWIVEEFTLAKANSLKDLCVAFVIVLDVSDSMNVHLVQLGLGGFKGLIPIIYSYPSSRLGFITAAHGGIFNANAAWTKHPSAKQGKFGNLMNLEDAKGRILNTRILTPDIPLPIYEEVFLHSASHYPKINRRRPPYRQGAIEQPLRALKSHIERNATGNLSFFEDCNILIAIIIANEDEKTGKKNATKALEVKNTFYHFYPDKKFIAYAITPTASNDPAFPPKPNLTCLAQEQERAFRATATPEIDKLAFLTGGLNASICSKDYEKMLKKLSQDIKDTIENSVILDKQPVPETVNVTFLTEEQSDWIVSGRKIVFLSDDLDSLHILVTYEPLELETQGL